MKYILIILFCLTAFFANAQIDSSSKSITIELDKQYKFSVKPTAEGTDVLKIVSVFLPIVVMIGSVWAILFQINARREDDILKNQLERLNKQITEFYGPLYSLYETGHRNHYNFLLLHGDDVSHKNPNFGIWSKNVFQPTNIGMENIIINKADLILGKSLPDCLLQFCQWSALMKVYNIAPLQNNFNDKKWERIIKRTPHPEISMQAFLRASFEVLKEEQSRLLSGRKISQFSTEKNNLFSEEVSNILSSEKNIFLTDAINQHLVVEINQVLSQGKGELVSEEINKLLLKGKSTRLSKEVSNVMLTEISKIVVDRLSKFLMEKKNEVISTEKINMLSEDIYQLLLDDIQNLLPKNTSNQFSKDRILLLSQKMVKPLVDDVMLHLSKRKIRRLRLKIKKISKGYKGKELHSPKIKLFSTKKDFVNEEILIKVINRRTEKYIRDSKRPNTPENIIWREVSSRKQNDFFTQRTKGKLSKHMSVIKAIGAFAGFWLLSGNIKKT